jgi:hypothetical protein
MNSFNSTNQAFQIIDKIKSKNGSKINDPTIPITVDTIELTKVTEKKTSASIYIANNFPLKLSVHFFIFLTF